jgi:small conductance mechanosensitive channel
MLGFISLLAQAAPPTTADAPAATPVAAPAADAASAAVEPAASGGFLETIGNATMEHLPAVLTVLVLIIVAHIVSCWIGRIATKGLEKAKVEKTLARFLGQGARWGVMIMALLACLSKFGIQTTSFAAVIGASALAVGLAFQGSLSHLAAGIMLLIFRPFKVGDLISAAGQLGIVENIELFNTMIDTPDNRRIIIPNGVLFGATIENLSHHPTRRVDIKVGVEYGADLDKTREVLTAAALAVPDTLADPASQIILLNLGDSSVDWQVRVWTETANYWTVWDAGTKIVKQHLDDAGLGIPFPQVDVHLDKPS